MNLLPKLKQEIKGFSLWFRIVCVVMAVVYLSLWIFTIHLSYIQKSKGIEPTLPGAPKDSIGYILISESIINGNGLSQNGRIETLRGFAYPLFAAIIKTLGHSYFAVTLVQIILVFASAFIIRRIGIVFSGRKVGEVAATLFLLNPVSMTLALFILTDVLFLFLFVLGFYLAVTIDQKKPFRRIFIVSIIFALAIYTRGMGIFALPIFMAPVLAAKVPFKLQAKLGGFIAVFIIFSTIPAIVRNYVRTGIPAFNGFESTNLSWIVPKFLANANGTKEVDETINFQKATGVPDSSWQDLSAYDLRYSSQISKAGEKIILERPFSYLKFHIVTSIPFLFPSSILFMRDAYDSANAVKRPFKYGVINALAKGDWKSFYDGVLEVWWKFAERVLWLFGLILGVVAAWKDRRNPLVWVFVFVSAYFMLLSGPAAGPRLSFQAWPYMFLLFASGGICVLQRLSGFFSKKGL